MPCGATSRHAQLKVMSAIEGCRTAAPRRARRALCEPGLRPHDDRLLQLPQPPLPQVPGQPGAGVDGGAQGRAAGGALLPRRVHAAAADRRDRLSEQGSDLRPPVQGECGDAADDRGRPEATRRQDRLHVGAAHLGLRDDASSARAHDRAGRRDLARRLEVDQRLGGLPVAREGAVAAVPRQDAGDAEGRARGRPSAVLRRARRSRRQGRVQGLPRAALRHQVARLRQAAVRRARSRCWPIWRATRIASRSPTAG